MLLPTHSLKLYTHYLTTFLDRGGTILKFQIGTVMWMQREMWPLEFQVKWRSGIRTSMIPVASTNCSLLFNQQHHEIENSSSKYANITKALCLKTWADLNKAWCHTSSSPLFFFFITFFMGLTVYFYLYVNTDT